MSSPSPTRFERIYDVPGFIGPLDVALFASLFQEQDAAGVAGDVLEIGAWYGRTAVLLEYLKDEREVLHVCDLFEDVPPTRAGRQEQAGSRAIPTRAEFEERFRGIHSTSPAIHQVPSSALDADDLGPRGFRFVHVDGSHVYEAVKGDVAIACELATDGGVVAFDDFANAGYPGVAAALWPEVAERDVEPFACSPSKLYAAKGAEWATRYRSAVREIASRHRYQWRLNELPESSIVSVWGRPPRKPLRTRVAGRLRRLSHRVRAGAPTSLLIPDHILAF